MTEVGALLKSEGRLKLRPRAVISDDSGLVISDASNHKESAML